MGIWKREPRAPKPQGSDGGVDRRTGERAPALGSTWTNGRALGTHLVTGGLIAAIVCGPVGVVIALARGNDAVAVQSSQSTGVLPASEQAAGSYAAGYVGAWLSASQDDTTDLARYIDPSTVQNITRTPWTYRDLSVVSIEPGTGTALTTVVVAANIEEAAPATTAANGPTQTWPRRYFQVAVQITGAGAIAPVGLPAPVAGPAESKKTVDLIYTTPLSPSSTLAQTVTQFLGAYLANSGNITRYTAPGSEINAVRPAPFSSISPTNLLVDQAPADHPTDGARVRVLATVSLTNAANQRLAATYALTLTARSGLWEISSVDAAPTEQATKSSTSTTPSAPQSPTGGATKGTNK